MCVANSAFHPSGVDKWVATWIRCLPFRWRHLANVRKVKARTTLGRHGVVCRDNHVWSIPERLELKFHERRYTLQVRFTFTFLPFILASFR